METKVLYKVSNGVLYDAALGTHTAEIRLTFNKGRDHLIAIEEGMTADEVAFRLRQAAASIEKDK